MKKVTGLSPQSKGGIACGIVLFLFAMAFAYKFGAHTMDKRMVSRMRRAENKAHVIDQRLAQCKEGRASLAEVSSSALTPEYIESLLEDIKFLEEEIQIANQQRNALAEQLVYQQNTHRPWDLQEDERMAHDADVPWEWDDLDEYWSEDDQSDLLILRKTNDTLTTTLNRLGEEIRKLELGATTTAVVNLETLLHCQKELAKIEEEAQLRKKHVDTSNMTEGEFELMLAKKENEKLVKSSRSKEVLEKDEEILKLRRQLANHTHNTADLLAIDKDLDRELKDVDSQREAIKKLKKMNEELEKKKTADIAAREKQIEALKAELEKKKKG